MTVHDLIGKWDRTSFYLNRPVFYACFGAAGLFVLSYFFPVLFTIGLAILLFAAISVLVEAFLLYRKKWGIDATRQLKERFSNGDANRVSITILNHYDFAINCTVIEELPFQLQERNWKRKLHLKAGVEDRAVQVE